jgi:hypothetical protein
MKRYRVGDDPKLDELDAILDSLQADHRPTMDEIVALPWRCGRCDRPGVDHRSFRELVRGPGDYHFPTRCDRCAEMDRRRAKRRKRDIPPHGDLFPSISA